MKTVSAATMCAAFLILLAGCQSTEHKTQNAPDADAQLATEIRLIEEQYGVRVGLFFIDTQNGNTAAYRADERFAFCSTFKAFAAAMVLQECSAQELDERIFFDADDVLDWAPVARTKTESGMTVAEICEAALQVSDNTAANLLFDLLGGVSCYTERLRALGDEVTMPVRREPTLNEFIPGSSDDTTTARQAAETLRAVCENLAKEDGKLDILLGWMGENTTGNELIRAGIPDGWTVADKSGSGSYGTRNDIAVIYRPGRAPVYGAVFTRHEDAFAASENRPVAQAAEAAFSTLF